MRSRSMIKDVLGAAWPIMVSYVPLGLACGILGAKAGLGPLQGFLLSITLISGGSQFMISNLWLAGLPVATIVASVGAISLRFALYSASLAPYLQKCKKREALAMAVTLIEEAYGVTLSKLSGGEKSGWTLTHALALNLVTIATWAFSVAAGGAVGSVLQVPTAVASFAMTALFVYLLWSQVEGTEKGTARGGVLAAAVGAAVTVMALKAAGQSAAAVPVGAVAGVLAALLWSERREGCGGADGGAGAATPEKTQEGGDAA